MGQKWGAAVPLLGAAGSPSNAMSPVAETYLPTKWHLDPSSRLATTDMGRKLGGCCAAFFVGELRSHLIQCGMGRGLSPYQMASSSIQPFSYNRHGPRIARTQASMRPQTSKVGAVVPFSWGSWVPNRHLTQCGRGRGIRTCQVSS